MQSRDVVRCASLIGATETIGSTNRSEWTAPGVLVCVDTRLEWNHDKIGRAIGARFCKSRGQSLSIDGA